MKLGFACVWASPPRSTWSGTPWSLREALARRVAVADVGLTPSRAVRTGFKAAFTRRHDGRWVTVWKHAARWQDRVEAELRAGAAAEVPSVDAVVEIGDLARFSEPYFTYQDLCFDALLDVYDEEAGAAEHFPGLGHDDLRRLRDRQLDVYAGAGGLLTMSHWLAATVVERSGVPASKVHVVHPGVDLPEGAATVPRLGPSNGSSGGAGGSEPRRRLLLVGRDFHTKGGDLVVEAVGRLRAEHDPSITLTIAGPKAWPLPGPVPAGVFFLGPVAPTTLFELYRSHDLLVMPSRLEGFGKVFAEALAFGLPCIGRAAYAMPEVIVPGENGALVKGSDVDELTAAVATALADDALYARCAARRVETAAYYSWDRAAAEVLAAVDHDRS